ncbi:MAG: hypothetical protein NTV79_01500, partial [Candidatus Aureabacteria bacterium]|nr:hypothetical protein [Candidatus Auribacterota bacterium]
LLGGYLLCKLAELVRPPAGRSSRRNLVSLLVKIVAGGIVYCALLWLAPELVGIFLSRIRMLVASVSGYLASANVHPAGYWRWFGAMLFKSFWLYFGWLRFDAPELLYGAWGGLTILSLLGGLARLLKGMAGEKEGRPESARHIVTLALFSGTALAAYYFFWGLQVAHTTTQSRHLFVAIPAWAVLFVWGMTGLFPPRRRDRVCRAIFLIMPLLAAVAFIGSVWKIYQ